MFVVDAGDFHSILCIGQYTPQSYLPSFWRQWQNVLLQMQDAADVIDKLFTKQSG
ncbi:MAG: hypothetical protein K0R78_232 [Pelosinus sp.]|jgi:hypothetical protein|nr:hypothetical protein [Pelosinus sp.]